MKAGIRGARSHGFQRGEMLFPVELAKIRLTQRRYDAAAALLVMAGSIYFASTLRARPRVVYQRLKTGALFALAILIPRRASPAADDAETPVHCPCGDHPD